VYDRKHDAELRERFNILWEAHACDDDYATLAPIDRLKGNKPNQWGLHDMLGNVWEWVEDCWHTNYDGRPKDGSAWEGGDCAQRVGRGGSWISGLRNAHSASRDGYAPGVRSDDVGFRLAQDN
jgi:formylglycine-generating enzyme required for sulfatase activity